MLLVLFGANVFQAQTFYFAASPLLESVFISKVLYSLPCKFSEISPTLSWLLVIILRLDFTANLSFLTDFFSVFMPQFRMKLVGHIALPSFVCPFIRSSNLIGACHILRTLYARVSKFYIWVPHEKLADFQSYAPLKKSEFLLARYFKKYLT